LRQQLTLFQVYHNFVLPHASLRLPLPQPEPTNGTGSTRQWRPCTPAMAAGLTDQVWTPREVLLYRVPPWLQPQTVEAVDAEDNRGVGRAMCVCRQAKRALRRPCTPDWRV
jgi:hypothetical protein